MCVTTSKQYGWCSSCGRLLVRESSDRIWSHANDPNHECKNLQFEPLATATSQPQPFQPRNKEQK